MSVWADHCFGCGATTNRLPKKFWNPAIQDYDVRFVCDDECEEAIVEHYESKEAQCATLL